MKKRLIKIALILLEKCKKVDKCEYCEYKDICDEVCEGFYPEDFLEMNSKEKIK